MGDRAVPGARDVTPEREQRRSPRFPAALEVQLAFGAERQVVRSVDVSQHGLFVATERPPRERFMVQLTISLPDGALPATAFVTRSVRRGRGPTPGVGLQLFALDAGAKHRWDRFVRGMTGHHTPLPGLGQGRIERNEERPTFLLKLRDEARLEELYAKNIVSGELYLATPVIKEPGTEVVLIVIHPRTEHEVPLVGRVVQVHRERPKGMAIRIHPPLTDAGRAAFLEFVRTGRVPAGAGPLPPSPVADPTDARTTLDIVIEPPVLYRPEQPEFDWSDVSDALIIDLDLDDDDPFAGRTPTPAAFAEGSWIEANAPEPRVEEVADLPFEPPVGEDGAPVPIEDLDLVADGLETISVDLDAPDSAPHPVAAPLPRDAELPVREPTTADLTPDLAHERLADDGPTSDLDRTRDPWAPEDLAPHHALHEPTLTVRLACSACDAPPVTLELGGTPGPLGYLARKKAYFCERCETFVAAVRLKPVAERRSVREALWLADPAALRAPVPLELLFEVAGMASASARCPICAAAGRSNDTTAAIEDALLTIEVGVPVHLEHAHCRSCGEAMVLELLGPEPRTLD